MATVAIVTEPNDFSSPSVIRNRLLVTKSLDTFTSGPGGVWRGSVQVPYTSVHDSVRANTNDGAPAVSISGRHPFVWPRFDHKAPKAVLLE
ncbi:hypothetical protein QLX08_008037 [Tetragonisca angustula]|uniref:Uncharacterized protein n=1 Tax=Tetragonisca angustula TaxID=166442 RepID=A0AAW0ZM77_9HYME